MKYNQVTWYSKTLAMILFIALPFAGFYLGMKYQEGINPPITTVVELSNGTTTKTLVSTDQVTVKTTYENGTLKYSGTVNLPSPCFELKTELNVLETFPEQVQIRLTTVNTAGPTQFCTQVINPEEFSGEVKVSKDATASVFLNDQKVE